MNKSSPKRSTALLRRPADSTREWISEMPADTPKRTENLDGLAAGLAHDLCSLLLVIDGCASLALTELPHAHPSADDLRELRAVAARANTIARQLVDLGRPESTRAVDADLLAIVRGLEPLLQRLLGDGVELSISSMLPESAQVNASQLGRVVMNLTTNARHAMPDGGRLTIQVGPSNRQGQICLSVRDTGLGMDQVTMERLFEPYFTTKTPGLGTGLGLVTVKDIVEGYGGEVVIESAPDCGTTVFVHLPLAKRNSDNRPDKVAPADSLRARSTVLLAEDDLGLRKYVSRSLIHAGYTVITARSGPEALALIDVGTSRPDLLVTGLTLPSMRGARLAELVTLRRGPVPVLYLSNDALDRASSFSGLTTPTSRVLARPFSTESLLKSVELLLRTSRTSSLP